MLPTSVTVTARPYVPPGPASFGGDGGEALLNEGHVSSADRIQQEVVRVAIRLPEEGRYERRNAGADHSVIGSLHVSGSRLVGRSLIGAGEADECVEEDAGRLIPDRGLRLGCTEGLEVREHGRGPVRAVVEAVVVRTEEGLAIEAPVGRWEGGVAAEDIRRRAGMRR